MVEELANRRHAEAQEAGRRSGTEYEVLDNHDGKLFPTLEVRDQVIREIRMWKADIGYRPAPTTIIPMIAMPDRGAGRVLHGHGTRHRAGGTSAPRRPVFSISVITSSARSPSGQISSFRSTTCIRRSSICSMRTSHSSMSGCPGTTDELDNVPKDPTARKQWIMTLEHRQLGTYQQNGASHWKSDTAARASKIQFAEAFRLPNTGISPTSKKFAGCSHSFPSWRWTIELFLCKFAFLCFADLPLPVHFCHEGLHGGIVLVMRKRNGASFVAVRTVRRAQYNSAGQATRSNDYAEDRRSRLWRTEGTYWSRRNFLKAGGASAAALGMGEQNPQWHSPPKGLKGELPFQQLRPIPSSQSSPRTRRRSSPFAAQAGYEGVVVTPDLHFNPGPERQRHRSDCGHGEECRHSHCQH